MPTCLSVQCNAGGTKTALNKPCSTGLKIALASSLIRQVPTCLPTFLLRLTSIPYLHYNGGTSDGRWVGPSTHITAFPISMDPHTLDNVAITPAAGTALYTTVPRKQQSLQALRGNSMPGKAPETSRRPEKSIVHLWLLLRHPCPRLNFSGG